MTIITAQRAPHSASNFAPTVEANAYGMNDRIKRLRQETFEAEPSLSIRKDGIITTAVRAIIRPISSVRGSVRLPTAWQR